LVGVEEHALLEQRKERVDRVVERAEQFRCAGLQRRADASKHASEQGSTQAGTAPMSTN
jgi:hypothetical protein